jgi:hypothetical protein
MRSLVLAFVLFIVLLPTAPLAEVPGLMSYQGLLTGDSGLAMDTTLTITFSIYDDSTAGVKVWTEKQAAVEVIAGIFNVLLGSESTISDTVFNEPDRWLAIQVDGETEMDPRQRITTVAYTFQAAEADTAEYARSGGSGGDDGDWTISGDNMYSAVPGDVGIGTATPGRHLHIVGDDTLGSVMIAPDQDASGSDAELILAEDDDGTYAMRVRYDGSSNQLQVFGEANSTLYGPHLVVTRNDGDLGIGTTNPSARLDVHGAVNTDSLYTIGGDPALSTPDPQNTFIGINAGLNNTGGYNTFVGYLTGDDNQGNYNTFIGQMAGRLNTTGGENTCLGFRAGYMNNASGNVFLGSRAGYSNTTGDGNTFLGWKAGYFNSTGSDNTFLGDHAGYSSTTGDGNTFLGDHAGYSHTSGDTNTFVGAGAGFSNTTGYSNTYVGLDAGYASSEGYGNTYIGKGAGRASTTSGYNTFLGLHAGYYNTTGSNNTCVGVGAGFNNSTGHGNTFVGLDAGLWGAGSYNVFIGKAAGAWEEGSNRLYIDNSDTTRPLIWGDFSNDRVVISGNDTDNTNDRTFFSNGPAGGTTAWYNDSDEGLKKDIATIPDALRKVQQLRGVNFEWRETENREPGRQMGFVAQEAAAIIPEVVTGQEGHYAMQYGPITALLVEALKEQQEVIEELQARIEVLEPADR